MSEMNVVLAELKSISTSTSRIEAKVDKMQEEQIRLSEKIVTIETWKQASQIEEKLGIVTDSQFRLIKLEEACKEIINLKDNVKKLEEFKNHSLGYAAGIAFAVALVISIISKVIH